MEGLQEYSPKSHHLIHQAVGYRLHWRRVQLTEMTDRQERQSRWILDQQAGRKLLEDQGPGKFTGRVGKQIDQEDLIWEPQVGAIYISRLEIDTQEFRGGSDKIIVGLVTWQQATLPHWLRCKPWYQGTRAPQPWALVPGHFFILFF